MRIQVLCLCALMAGACYGDETVRAYGGADRIWHLVEMHGKALDSEITLTFPETGRIAGQAPCNRYFASMEVPYPWFEAGPIGSTRMACDDLALESTYLKALGQAQLSEVLGNVLILSDDKAPILVFNADG